MQQTVGSLSSSAERGLILINPGARRRRGDRRKAGFAWIRPRRASKFRVTSYFSSAPLNVLATMPTTAIAVRRRPMESPCAE
jgi:hypothetical protein